jgi:HK97 family phage major capsid protein
MSKNDEARRAELEEKSLGILAEMNTLEDSFGADRAGWPAGHRERYDRLKQGLQLAARELEDVATRAERMERIREAAQNPRNVERGDACDAGAPRSSLRRSPWTGLDDDVIRTESATGWRTRAEDALGLAVGLSDAGRKSLARMVDREGSEAAALVVAASNPVYRDALNVVLANPERGMWTLTEEQRAAVGAVEAARASLSTNTGTGGWLVPLALQPSLSIANDGAANPFRQMATVEQTISSPARLVKSTGITAEWKTENAAASDASPTFTKVDVSLFAASAYADASYEIAQDARRLMDDLPRLFADARDRIEAAAFATGDGSAAPAGVVTRVTAVTASRVSPATGGAFVVGDVYKVWDALPARARQSSKVGWIAHNAILSKIRQFDTAGGSAFWADLGASTPANLLGAPIYEASSMASSVTTGSNVLLAGDFSAFHIFDHVAGTTLHYIPAVIDQATGRPKGAAGWHMFGRVGSDVADESQFRVLKL